MKGRSEVGVESVWRISERVGRQNSDFTGEGLEQGAQSQGAESREGT